MDGDVESSEVLYISSRGWAKKSFYNGRSCVDTEYYGAIHLMFDTFKAPGCIVFCNDASSGIKKANGAPVTLHVLSKCVACWLVSVGIVQCHVTHVVQNTQYCEIAMQDFTKYINSQLEIWSV